MRARVLVAGAGGLGCAALPYLAAAGIGTIGIADDDTVQLSNLHRQVLYTTEDIGASKAERAARWLQQLNPEINIQVHPIRLTSQNALDIITQYDIVVDGTDNPGSKYLINDACVLLHKPVVFGAVSEFEGQVAVFNYGLVDAVTANYRDLYPVPPNDVNETSCMESGVLGVLPGIIGTMQSNEAIKLITGIGKPLINRLLTYNALTCETHEFILPVRKRTRLLIPGNESEFIQAAYNRPGATDAREQLEVNGEEFSRLINKDDVLIIDVREPDSKYSPADFRHVHIPCSQLPEKLDKITGDKIITFCERGIKSLRATKILKEAFGPSKEIFSLNKGIYEWNQICRNVQR